MSKGNCPVLVLLMGVLGFTLPVVAQKQITFEEERAKEDYGFLRDSTDLPWTDAIKYIALNKHRYSFLSLGGSARTRFEHQTNQKWIPDNPENYYSQRLIFHGDLRFDESLRFFGELQHGYKTDGETFLQTDDVDIHQGFIELKKTGADQLSFRFGRQEMKLGAGRLVDLRIGPNVRRSFDLVKATLTRERQNVTAFYGKEVLDGVSHVLNRQITEGSTKLTLKKILL